LCAPVGRRLTKRIYVDDSIDDYDLVRFVNLTQQEVRGAVGLYRLLGELTAQPDRAVVRGAIADPTRARRVRRLLHSDLQTGEAATLIEQPRRWVALDFDRLDRPNRVEVTDLEACGEVAIATLPEAFHDAACVVQATASHAIKPGIRLRLWYWLDRPTSGGELKYWLRDTPADPAAFRPAQLIYIATPLFAGGACDPLRSRLAWLRGSPSVHVLAPVALYPPPRPEAPPMPEWGSVGAADYAMTALARGLLCVGRAKPGKRNPTLFLAACRLAPLIRRRLLEESVVVEALTMAAKRVGIDAEPHRDAAHEAKKAVKWAMGRSCRPVGRMGARDPRWDCQSHGR
jgi:hypothetical protein